MNLLARDPAARPTAALAESMLRDVARLVKGTPQERFAAKGHIEAVSVYVYDPRAGADACGAATAIATAVAAKLPPPG